MKREERESAVDSGSSMHLVSKRDLNYAELETMRISRKSDYGDDGQRRQYMSTSWTYSCQ